MSENRKNNHEIVGGDVSDTSAHKHCGREFEDTHMRNLITCIKNPIRAAVTARRDET